MTDGVVVKVVVIGGEDRQVIAAEEGAWTGVEEVQWGDSHLWLIKL